MACGCFDNKKLKENIHVDDNKQLNDSKQLYNNKILKLDSIQNLPIDEIINLYKDGYRLEQLGDNIKSLNYGSECSGSPALDRSYTTTNPADYIPIAMKFAYAQKFTPTFRCLSSVKLRVRKVLDVDATVAICSDSGGKPAFPTGILGEFTRSYSELSYSFTEVDFPLNILLSNLNPLWIVITSMYDPNYTLEDTLIEVDAFWDTNGNGNNLCFKNGTNAWIYKAYARPFFKTMKLNYAAPVVLTSITVSPPTASINVNATQQLSAECKDQNNTTMTCPTLTWESDNSSVATVNSAGLVTAVSTGTDAHITARVGSIVSNASMITVTSPSQVLTSIAISPTTASINVSATQQLSAICKDQNNATMTCPTLSWVSSVQSKATVNSSGLVIGVAAGNTNITATHVSPSVTSNNSVITVNAPGGATCQSITTPTATPSTIAPGSSTTLRATVTPSIQTSQEFSVQFMDGNTQIGNPVTTINQIATKAWIPIVGTHDVSAKVGSECTSPSTVQVVVNPGATPESGGAGIVVVIAAVVAAAVLLSKKG